MNKSILLFLLACIPVRILMAIAPKILEKDYLPYYGIILLAIAIGFLYLYFFNLRLEAPEAGGKTWWANLRIVHGLLYLIAAILALQSDSNAWIPLAMDVFFGLFSFINHHFL
jgi:hypothetical protein